MSPRLKPLLLPQLVEERRKVESVYTANATSTVAAIDQPDPYVYYTTNSSSSDVASPVTPTFSTKGHLRYSSSTSSLDLVPQLQDSPSSPLPPTSSGNTKAGMRQLPDVQEEPVERDEDDTIYADQFELYSCLCDEPCEHRRGSDGMLPGNYITDYDVDYDAGFMSDYDQNTDFMYPNRKRTGSDSPFHSFTARFGNRFAGMNPWKQGRKSNLMASPTTELSFENAMSRASSRESSMSASRRGFYDRSIEQAIPATPAMSYYASTESIAMSATLELEEEDRASLERERALATTPLLPPLVTDPRAKQHFYESESPLQSPSVAPSPIITDVTSPALSSAQFPKPALSTKPSVSSFRHLSSNAELPIPLPAILLEHDEWSDRLGHANFTITPLPYDVDVINADTVSKFCQDWDAARVNYTKHLVRTGENYGQTSKIYGLTEAKWAETEGRWRTIYEGLVRQTMARNRTVPASASSSRSRSRGRGRGRAGSASASLMGRQTDDVFAGIEWRRLEGALPSAVPQMIEALDAEGKFPNRGDEDIVGPMQRDEVMIRSESEERKSSRFWRSLIDKVGLRK